MNQHPLSSGSHREPIKQGIARKGGSPSYTRLERVRKKLGCSSLQKREENVR